jgi:hypothetical protein
MLAPSLTPSTRTLSNASWVRSTGTTATAPSGTVAPVEIAIASPGPTARSAGDPARESPTTSSAPPSVAATA